MNQFLDFDDVLFDARGFVEDFKCLLRENGVSDELLSRYYSINMSRPEGYTSKTHFLVDNPSEMERILNTDRVAEIMHAWNALVDDLRAYVFSDAHTFLEEHCGDDLYLVTRGSDRWQKTKIYGCRIQHLFKKVVVVRGRKSDAIRHLCGGVSRDAIDGCFVDDRRCEIDDVSVNLPRIRTFWLARPGGYHVAETCTTCDHVVRNLQEVNVLL